MREKFESESILKTRETTVKILIKFSELNEIPFFSR